MPFLRLPPDVRFQFSQPGFSRSAAGRQVTGAVPLPARGLGAVPRSPAPRGRILQHPPAVSLRWSCSAAGQDVEHRLGADNLRGGVTQRIKLGVPRTRGFPPALSSLSAAAFPLFPAG